MKIKHQLSIATLVMAGVFATGCSQQSVMGEGGSQVAGGQQAAGGSQVAGGQQAAGGSQVAGGQQAAGGQQVADDTQVVGGQQVAGGQQQTAETQIPDVMVPKTPMKVVPPKKKPMQKPMQKPKQVMRPRPRPSAGNCHGHAKSKMTKVVRHCHKNPTGRHGHKGKMAQKPAAVRTVVKTVYKSVPKVIYKDRVIYKPVYKTVKAPAKRVVRKAGRWCHSHPANSMTKSVSHCHKYNQRNHSHMYGGAKRRVQQVTRTTAPKRTIMPPKTQQVDVFALQQKLKAKGYYKGPIDGVVGRGTRSALQQFMQNR